MKKLFTLFCLVAMVAVMFAQTQQISVDANTVAHHRVAPSLTKPVLHHNSTSRANTTSILLDYDANDNQYATNIGSTYAGFLWNLNSKLPNTTNNTMRYAMVLFDTLQYVATAPNITFIPKAAATVTLDSFTVAFIHNHTTNTNDSIRFTVFNTNAKVVTGQGTAAAVATTPKIWDTLIVTNATIPLNSTNYTFLTFPTNLTLPQGQSFGIRVDFKGDTANKFEVVAGYRDDCAAACMGGSEYSVAGNNTGYYLNAYIATSSTNLSGYFENDNPNYSILFYDCDASGGYTPHGCENLPIQNLWIFANVTVQANFGTAITADSLKGCPGAQLNLAANVFGTNSTNLTYTWSTNNGTISDPSSATTQLIIGNTSATVTLVVSDGSTSVTATVVVASKGIKVAITNPSPPITINCGANVLLLTSLAGSSSTVGKNYTWSTGVTGATSSTITVNSPGTYIVTVTNNSGCSASASISVIYPGGLNNVISFTPPPTPRCATHSLTFTNTSARQSGWGYQWTFGDGNLGFSQNGTDIYASPGSYTVVLTQDSGSCSFTSPPYTITVLSATNAACTTGIEDVTFSNAISMMPNPSNGNVSFTVNGVEKNITIKVYNIIGSEVKTFTANDVNAVFTKTFDFSDLANGTYLIKIQSADKTAVKRLTISK